MSRTEFSQYLLNLIEEDDRLTGLAEAVDIRLEEDPVNNQWVFSIAPRRDIPLPITPSTQYGVAVEELDTTIRAAWGEVAQLARDVTKDSLEAVLIELQAMAPNTPTQQPPFDVWLPTTDHNRYESVRTVVQWDINQMEIKPSYAIFHLVLSNGRYAIVDPLGNRHDIVSRPIDSDVSTAKEVADTSFDFDLNDETSVDTAFERARDAGLNQLSPAQHEKLKHIKKRTRIFSFLNGLTIFTGVVAFLFFLMGAHMVVPFLGPIFYIGAVVYAYNRD